MLQRGGGENRPFEADVRSGLGDAQLELLEAAALQQRPQVVAVVEPTSAADGIVRRPPVQPPPRLVASPATSTSRPSSRRAQDVCQEPEPGAPTDCRPDSAAARNRTRPRTGAPADVDRRNRADQRRAGGCRRRGPRRRDRCRGGTSRARTRRRRADTGPRSRASRARRNAPVHEDACGDPFPGERRHRPRSCLDGARRRFPGVPIAAQGRAADRAGSFPQDVGRSPAGAEGEEEIRPLAETRSTSAFRRRACAAISVAEAGPRRSAAQIACSSVTRLPACARGLDPRQTAGAVQAKAAARRWARARSGPGTPRADEGRRSRRRQRDRRSSSRRPGARPGSAEAPSGSAEAASCRPPRDDLVEPQHCPRRRRESRQPLSLPRPLDEGNDVCGTKQRSVAELHDR